MAQIVSKKVGFPYPSSPSSQGPSRTMVYLSDIQDFETAAQELFKQQPLRIPVCGHSLRQPEMVSGFLKATDKWFLWFRFLCLWYSIITYYNVQYSSTFQLSDVVRYLYWCSSPWQTCYKKHVRKAVRHRTRYLVKYRHKEGKVRGPKVGGFDQWSVLCERSRSFVLDGFKLVRPQFFQHLQTFPGIIYIDSSQLKSKIKLGLFWDSLMNMVTS